MITKRNKKTEKILKDLEFMIEMKTDDQRMRYTSFGHTQAVGILVTYGFKVLNEGVVCAEINNPDKLD